MELRELFRGSTRQNVLALLDNSARYTINRAESSQNRLKIGIGKWLAVEENEFFNRAVCEMRVSLWGGLALPRNLETNAIEQCFLNSNFIELTYRNAGEFHLKFDMEGGLEKLCTLSPPCLDFMDSYKEIQVNVVAPAVFRSLARNENLSSLLFDEKDEPLQRLSED